jgi:hypothetical protein
MQCSRGPEIRLIAGWQNPNGDSLKPHLSFFGYRIESEEPNDHFAVLVGGTIQILFPFFDGGIGDPKSKANSKLRHGQLQIHSLLAKVFAKSFGVGWILL